MDTGHRSSSQYSSALILRWIGRASLTEVVADFSYDAGDPFAVRMTFGAAGSGSAVVTWLVAREVLWTGLERAAGEGDVRLGPAGPSDVLFLHLGAPSGEALFELSRAALKAFLRGTAALVPLGAETVDLDDELAALLSDGRADPAAG
jgi:hypothetical protein